MSMQTLKPPRLRRRSHNLLVRMVLIQPHLKSYSVGAAEGLRMKQIDQPLPRFTMLNQTSLHRQKAIPLKLLLKYNRKASPLPIHRPAIKTSSIRIRGYSTSQGLQPW